MTTPLFKTVPVSSLTAAHLGYTGTDEYTVKRGQEMLTKYVTTYKSYVGKIISVSDSRRTVQVMSDIWEDWTERTVTVWSDLKGEAVTFVSDSAGYGTPATASAYEVDATPETVAKYRRWVSTVSIPAAAARAAEAHLKSLEIDNEEKRNRLVSGLHKGRTYRVVRGRKYPHGLMGVLVWHGENRFGPTAMVATSDRKDARGRYADVIFISPNNLEVVEDDASKAELKRLLDERTTFAAEVEKTYRAEVEKRLTEVAKEWGVSVDTLVRRASEVATEEATKRIERETEMASVLSYADGPNYDNDLAVMKRLTTEAKSYQRLVAALAA